MLLFAQARVALKLLLRLALLARIVPQRQTQRLELRFQRGGIFRRALGPALLMRRPTLGQLLLLSLQRLALLLKLL